MKSLMRSSARSVRGGLLGLAALAVLAKPDLASADCGGWGPDFGQSLPNCGEASCYVVSPGGGTPQSLLGTFWSFGTGNPAFAHGDDNGAWPATGWLVPWESGRILAGSWDGSSAIDGCIAGKIAPGKPAEVMIALLSDESPGAGDSFFAVASARRIVGENPEFDFTFVNGGGAARNIDLVQIPRTRITSSSQPPVTLHFAGPSLADVTPGIYGDNSLATEEILKGYRLYTNTAATVSSLKTSAGWTAISGILPLGQSSQYVVQPCPQSGKVRFGWTLAFEGDFETPYVGKYVTVSCRYCADLDGDGFISLQADPECCPLPDECDCNDAAGNVHPGALEVCNGIDDNCNNAIDDVGLPGSVAAVRLDKEPATTEVDWSAVAAATSYDVVRGDLTALLAGGGSYADATDACVADNVTTNHTDDPLDPDPNSAFWYLIRAANCSGVGSYDTPGPSQVTPRDAGIAQSGHACP